MWILLISFLAASAPPTLSDALYESARWAHGLSATHEGDAAELFRQCSAFVQQPTSLGARFLRQENRKALRSLALTEPLLGLRALSGQQSLPLVQKTPLFVDDHLEALLLSQQIPLSRRVLRDFISPVDLLSFPSVDHVLRKPFDRFIHADLGLRTRHLLFLLIEASRDQAKAWTETWNLDNPDSFATKWVFSMPEGAAARQWVMAWADFLEVTLWKERMAPLLQNRIKDVAEREWTYEMVRGNLEGFRTMQMEIVPSPLNWLIPLQERMELQNLTLELEARFDPRRPDPEIEQILQRMVALLRKAHREER